MNEKKKRAAKRLLESLEKSKPVKTKDDKKLIREHAQKKFTDIGNKR
jgi:hypothetical protein